MYNDEIRRLYRKHFSFSCVILLYVRTADVYYNNIIRILQMYNNILYYKLYGTMVAAAAAANGNLFTKGRR